jgi:hypothetical protein
MKRYYTLVQPFVGKDELSLEAYLAESCIQADVGADLASELVEFGYKNFDEMVAKANGQTLLKKYVVLLEEHELTAIKLAIGNVQVLENRPAIDLQNKVRGCFKWFLN